MSNLKENYEFYNKSLARLLNNAFTYSGNIDKEKFSEILVKEMCLLNKYEQIIDKMAEHIEELQNKLFDLDMLKEYKFATTKKDIIKYYKGE